jgi:Ca2+-binding EF-hand superfamily protein
MKEIKSKSIRANKFSEQIVRQSRQNKINDIFAKLDSDNDGLISTEKIDLSVLDD